MIFIDNDESTSAIDNIPFTSTTGKPTTIEFINIDSPKIGGSYGWICPVCGRGNAPWNSYCPCKVGPNNIEITY